MQCPNCALYHPARYEVCVSCGSKLVGDGESTGPSSAGEQVRRTAMGASGAPRALDSENQPLNPAARKRASKQVGSWFPGGLSTVFANMQTKLSGGKSIPLGLGITIAAFILCASAGVTFFFLTKPPEDQRLLQQGQKQLRDGQYAFALKTLTQAAHDKPDDPRILLALARAYVGVDQVDKAWQCITQAQQLGAGVVAEPQLASDLANYYRQRNMYQRAVELLRPLAANNIPGKKAELADLDGLWGDDCLREGDYLQAMKCWEEVRDMHEGSRYMEADGRLSSVYQKIADEMTVKGDTEEALRYLTKLNVLAPSAAALEKTADLYQRQGQLELAIDQLRKATKLASGDSSPLNHKLAAIMVARGKELLDQGQNDAGYGYLQQAQALDARIKAPSTAVRNMHIEIEPGSGYVHAGGEVWNPGPATIQALTLKSELFDSKAGTILWTKDQHIVDEFEPPLAPRESRRFDIMSAAAGGDPNTNQLRIYLNGTLYKAYSLKDGGSELVEGKSSLNSAANTAKLRPPIATPNTGSTSSSASGNPPVAPNYSKTEGSSWLPQVAPNAVPGGGPSAEEKTLKDLE